MRKTKIVCTLGPATDGEGVLREMMLAGMNVARFNFSHGTHSEHKARLEQVKALRQELDLPVAAMLDTKGPEVRLKNFAGGSVTLQEGQEFTLTVEDVEGDATRCAVTYAELPQDVKAGDTILLDDGLVRLTVLSTTASAIRCRVENGGVMKDHKGVNVPGVSLSMPYMSQQDREDILFGMEEGFDFIAASFVRSAADVRELRKLLESRKSRIRIIAKIENQEGINNLTEILAAADGIMVARGDMGVEIDFTEIPAIQKNMIAQCVAAGKPVITATQMLDSMIENPRPTRAEITDVANAIYDGTSCIMLSGETAAGKYPVEALETMVRIAEKAEESINYIKRFNSRDNSDVAFDVTNAISHATCTTAHDLGAKAIITVTKSGVTARQLATMAATIANSGVNPVTGKAVFKPELTPKIASMMATVGFYEHTGDWLFTTGLPAKTGVGGGIMGVVPGVMGVAAFAPPLDGAGNSVKAQKALAFIAGHLNLNVFGTTRCVMAGKEPVKA